jgi:hypothetical protein
MRTEEEIQSAIEYFREEKKTLPKFSYFGYPNHLIADVKIDIFEE